MALNPTLFPMADPARGGRFQTAGKAKPPAMPVMQRTLLMLTSHRTATARTSHLLSIARTSQPMDDARSGDAKNAAVVLAVSDMLIAHVADEIRHHLVDEAQSPGELARDIENDQGIRLEIAPVERVEVSCRHHE